MIGYAGNVVADPNVKWVQFRSYAGPHIRLGTAIDHVPVDHVSRAYWLTTKVETGAYFGRVMAYDGTCMTAGPDQHIAVYPRELANEDGRAENDLGSLWGLFADIRALRGSTPSLDAAIDDLVAEMVSDGFSLGQDGRPRYVAARKVSIKGRKISVAAGDLVHGNVLRDTYTPMGGRVPARGPAWEKAKRWAILWHRLTANPSGFETQFGFGVRHLVERTKRRRLPGLGPVEEAVYGSAGIEKANLPRALDLALCVYHAHSVNGPAPANRALADALKRRPIGRDPEATARELIARLGNNTYGRWDDDIKNGRYARTRTHALKSGLWPRELFEGGDAIMPRDLPG